MQVPLTMIEVPLETAAGFFLGAMGCERTAGGVTPVRLPASAWDRVPDLWAREMFRMGSGVRLAFVTSASAFELDARASVMTIEGGLLDTPPPAFDLYVDGHDRGRHEISLVAERRFDVEREPILVTQTPVRQDTLLFGGLGSAEKTVELWFPANGIVEVTGLRANAPIRGVDPEGQRRWIHYGSSISHGREVGRPTSTWPAVAARLGDVDLLNLGVGGNCHLDPFVARAIRDTRADAISLKVGIHIAMDATFTRRTFGPALNGFLDTVRDGHPDVPILAISPIICPLLEDATGPIGTDGDGALTAMPVDGTWNALSLRRIREIVEDIVDARSRDDRNLFYLDGRSLFGLDDVGELPDGIHPSAGGYVTLAERFARLAFEANGPFG
jgi:GDSL-like Lipase/Acylhydrolase family